MKPRISRNIAGFIGACSSLFTAEAFTLPTIVGTDRARTCQLQTPALKLSLNDIPNTLGLDIDSSTIQNIQDQVVSTASQYIPDAQLETLSAIATAGYQGWDSLPVPLRIALVGLPLLQSASNYELVSRPPTENTYPEQTAATYDLRKKILTEFGTASFLRPLLKKTQLEYRSLQCVYDANRDGFDAKIFHQKVDGKGASIVLAKAGGQWFGGYNPRGWASLGGSRPSIASFLFYKEPLGGRWQKLRCLGNGGMACGNDLFDRGIYLGAEGLVIPLDGTNRRSVASRLGTYFEFGPNQKTTLLREAGAEARLQDLKVFSGVYAPGEDIPNSGGVLDLGLY